MPMRRLKDRRPIATLLICCVMAIAMSLLRPGSVAAQDEANTYRDDLEWQMAWSLMEEDFNGYLSILFEYLELGGAYVPDMIYYEAIALEKTTSPIDADRTLDKFFDRTPVDHPRYGDALALRAAIQPRLDEFTKLSDLYIRDDLSDVEKLAALYSYLRRNWTLPEARWNISLWIAAIELSVMTTTDFVRRELPGKLEIGVGPASRVAISPDSRRVAFATGYGGGYGIHIRFLDDDRVQWRWTRPVSGASMRRGVAFSPSFNYLTTGSEGGAIHVWDLANGQRVRHLNEPRDLNWKSVCALAMAHHAVGEARIAAVERDGWIVVYNVRSGAVHWRFQHPGAVPGYGCSNNRNIALSADGRRLLTVFNNAATLWDVDRKSSVRVLREANFSAYSGTGALSPDGRHVLTAEGFDAAELWDAETGQKLMTLYGHQATPMQRQWPNSRIKIVGFSNTGRFFTAGLGTIHVYDLDGALVRVLDPLHGDVNFDGVAISPDGKRLVSVVDTIMDVWTLP